MNKNKILYTIIFVLSVILIFLLFKNSGNYVSDAGAMKEEEEPIAFKSLETPVEVQVIHKQNLIQTISSNGTVKAQREAEIIPQVSGICTWLNYAEGDFVHKDSIIFEIDDKLYRIEYLKAQEQVQKTLAEYGIMILGEQENQFAQQNNDSLNYASANLDLQNKNDREAFELLNGNERKTMLASKAGLTAARLDFERTKINLANTVIRAPFDGFIADLKIFRDGLVKTGEPALKIVGLTKLFVEVGILETEIPFIKKGTRAQIEFPAFPGTKVNGYVKTINSVLDEKSGTCRIQIEIDNPNLKIKPGMFANVTIETQLYPERLLIPRDALLIRDERKVTFVYENGRAKWHYVTTGLENDDYFEVIEGLSHGDSLIVSGHFNLAHDALVVLVEKE